MARIAIAVIGAGECSEQVAEAAREIGRLIAERDATLVTGGSTGVMAAASHGAHEAGGLVVGIIPGLDPNEANEHVDVVIPTGMGQLRNGLVVTSASAIIALPGEWGTLSEIGLALKLGKPVIGWRTWDLGGVEESKRAIVRVDTPREAVEEAFARCVK